MIYLVLHSSVSRSLSTSVFATYINNKMIVFSTYNVLAMASSYRSGFASWRENTHLHFNSGNNLLMSSEFDVMISGH